MPKQTNAVLNMILKIIQRKENWIAVKIRRYFMQKYLFRHKFWAICYFFGEILIGLLNVVTALVLAAAVDAFVTEGGLASSSIILFGASFLGFLMIVSFFYSYVRMKYFGKTRETIESDIAKKLLIRKKDNSEVINIYNNEIPLIMDSYLSNILAAFSMLFGFFAAVVYAVTLSWHITIFVLVLGILSFFVNKIFANIIEIFEK